MIPARFSRGAWRLFRLYLHPAMRRQFHSIHLLGEEPEWPSEYPLVILPNHCSWWDGFFIYILNDQLWHRRPFLMMLEEQLSQHRFFTRLGVFSVDPSTPGGVRQSLRYTRELLTGGAAQERFLCLFPQGELRPWFVRPLGYKPGILWLLEKAAVPVCLVQLGFRIEFLLQQRPQVFCEFSQPILWSGQDLPLGELEARHAALLDRMNQRLLDGEEGKILFQGSGSVNTRWLRWRRFFGREK